LHSFVPSTIPSWNSLPHNVTNAPTLPAFKALSTNFVNRVHPYILAHAIVVPFAFMHKFIIDKKAASTSLN